MVLEFLNDREMRNQIKRAMIISALVQIAVGTSVILEGIRFGRNIKTQKRITKGWILDQQTTSGGGKFLKVFYPTDSSYELEQIRGVYNSLRNVMTPTSNVTNVNIVSPIYQSERRMSQGIRPVENIHQSSVTIPSNVLNGGDRILGVITFIPIPYFREFKRPPDNVILIAYDNDNEGKARILETPQHNYTFEFIFQGIFLCILSFCFIYLMSFEEISLIVSFIYFISSFLLYFRNL